MADYGKGMTMTDACCEWVRDRLPLLAEENDEFSGESSDLVDAADRGRIEQHLAGCDSCRDRWNGMKQVMSILSLAAAEPPCSQPRPADRGAASSSIWASVEDRIERHNHATRSRWRRILRAACPDLPKRAIDRVRRVTSQVRDELPLQAAWMQDTAQEFLADRFGTFIPALRRASGSWLRRTMPAPRFAVSLAMSASLGVALLGGYVAGRQRINAEHQIAADALPIISPFDDPSSDALDPRAFSEDVVTSSRPITSLRVSDSLADLDANATPSGPPSRSTVAGKVSSMATTAPTSSPRYDFDLEHGTPMPPETRGAKPAY